MSTTIVRLAILSVTLKVTDIVYNDYVLSMSNMIELEDDKHSQASTESEIQKHAGFNIIFPPGALCALLIANSSTFTN